MTTTADRRAAELLMADAYALEAVAAEMHAKAQELLGNAGVAEYGRGIARNARHASASYRQDAEALPHNSEVE